MDKIHTFGDQNEQDEEGLSICHIQNKNCSKINISGNLSIINTNLTLFFLR